MKEAKERVLFKVILGISALILIAINTFFDINSILATLCVIISAVLVFKYRDKWELFIVFGFIAYSNYSICMANYISPIDDFFTQFRSENVSKLAINILFAFCVILFLGTKEYDKEINVVGSMRAPDNSLIVFALDLLLILVMIFCFRMPSQAGERGEPNAIYEYAIILFIIGFYYAKGIWENSALVFISCIYILQNLVNGSRIVAIQLGIVLLLVVVKNYIKPMKMIPVFFVLLIVVSGIGMMRSEFRLDMATIKGTIETMLEGKLVNDTSYAAYHTSLTFLKVGEQIGMGDRLELFTRFAASILLGGRVENSVLNVYTHQYYQHYYGGVFPFYWSFYLGTVGVVLSTVLIASLINKLLLKESRNGYVKCLSLYFVATCPRWYLYTPLVLFRGFLFMTIVYACFYLLDKFIKQKGVQL